MNHIIAFDPGKTTGWARLTGADSFASGEVDLETTLHFVFENLKSGSKPVIICEDFIFTAETAKKSRQTWSTEGIGVLRFLAREFGCEFVLQSPASAKSFGTNDKLKIMGWYTAGKQHANDAARHLMVYAVANGRINVRDFMK